MRDSSIDLGRGLAILFVYFSHSILYHPINMLDMYPWCKFLHEIFGSFMMPIFFIISGYLFSKTHKSTGELYKGKTLRIFVPYLTTMAIIIGMKLVLPMEMSYNYAVGKGAYALIINVLLQGGDRWFVHTLFIIFLLLIPIRRLLKNKYFDMVLIAVLIVVYFLHFLPTTLAKVFYYMAFFVAGYTLDELYSKIRAWSLKYWWMIYLVAVLVNGVFIMYLEKFPFVYRFILPFTGTLAVMTLAFKLEKSIECNVVAQYIEYCGKYSLQFYLFSFCYPIIRTVIVSVMHITNPYVIVTSVFVLQLIAITIIVEITRRIKWLKIPCGY